MSHVELYEALKERLGETGARMIAEVVPPAADLATKQDLAGVEAQLRGEIQASTATTLRWMLAFFIPVWAGTWGTVIAVLLRGV